MRQCDEENTGDVNNTGLRGENCCLDSTINTLGYFQSNKLNGGCEGFRLLKGRKFNPIEEREIRRVSISELLHCAEKWLLMLLALTAARARRKIHHDTAV